MIEPDSSIALIDHQPAPIRQHAGPRLGLPTSSELQALEAYGNVVVASGMAPAHIKTWQAAVVVMRYGHQLGIDEFTALQNLFIIGGKPAAMASLLHAVILRDHGGDAIEILESSTTACRLACRRRGSHKVTEVGYTLKEADAAGLTGAPGSTWKKYPADLLFARAVSRAGRMVFRDSTMGLYVPEEIGGSAIEVNGEVIDVEGRETPHRITGSTTPTGAKRSLAGITDRAAAANANRDQAAWKSLIAEVGKNVDLWPALIAQSPSKTHLAWLEKAANGKGQALRPHFDRRRGELAALVAAGEVADHDNTAGEHDNTPDDDGAEYDPATGERIPDWVGKVAATDQLAGMPTPTRGRTADQIAGVN